MCIIQPIYAVYLTIFRPFDVTKANIIEIINEWYFTLLTEWLLYYRTAKRWDGAPTRAYITIISTNTIVIFCVVAIDLIRGIIAKLICKSNISTINESDKNELSRNITERKMISNLNVLDENYIMSSHSDLHPHSAFLHEEEKIDINIHIPHSQINEDFNFEEKFHL